MTSTVHWIVDTILFADDTTLQVSDTDTSTLHSRMNRVLDNAVQWSAANFFTLNSSKTKYIRFSNKKSHVHDLPIKIGDETIERIGTDCKTKSFKFLGMDVDDKLNWSLHVNKLRKKLNSGCFGLSNGKNFLSTKARCLVYNSLVMSHLSYCCMIYGCTMTKHLNYLGTVQKRAIRHVVLAKYKAHTEPIFLGLKYLNLVDTIIMAQSIFMHKYDNGHLPASFNNMYQIVTQIGEDRVRGDCGKYFIPKFKYPEIKSPKWEAVKTWNILPLCIRQIRKESEFKKRIEGVPA